MLEGHDGVDPLLDERRTRILGHDDALVDGSFNIDKTGQNLLQQNKNKNYNNKISRSLFGSESMRKIIESERIIIIEKKARRKRKR